MSAGRNAGVAGAAIVGVTTGLLGLGYVAANAVVRADRRRTGVSGDLTQLALAALADPPGTRTSDIGTRDGGRIHLRERGHAHSPPMVLLHGVTLDGSIWHNQLSDLSDDFRVIAPDWRGHGRSTPGRAGFGLDSLADDLDQLLSVLDLRGAVLVGHSMGGMAIMRFCARFPDTLSERVDSLVFQSTAASDVASGPWTVPVRIARLVAERSPKAAGRLTKVPADVGYAGARLGFGRNPSPVWVEQTRLLLDAMDPVALAGSVVPLFDLDERQGLRAVTTRSLILVGSHDMVTPPVQSSALAVLLRNSELQIVPDAGHTLMLERSGELSGTLRRFAVGP